MIQRQVEARLVQEGDVLFHPGTEAWVTVTEVRRVPNTKRWLALVVRSQDRHELTLYVEDSLPFNVRRPENP